jgi:hypothetical protein
MAAILSQQRSAGIAWMGFSPHSRGEGPHTLLCEEGQDGMNSDSTGFAPARLRSAAFSSLGQCDGNGLLDCFFFVGGWLVPIDPSFFHSCTIVLILLLTTDWLNPFLSGMISLLSAVSIGRAFHQSRRNVLFASLHQARESPL